MFPRALNVPPLSIGPVNFSDAGKPEFAKPLKCGAGPLQTGSNFATTAAAVVPPCISEGAVSPPGLTTAPNPTVITLRCQETCKDAACKTKILRCVRM